jgi:hypothetical protein
MASVLAATATKLLKLKPVWRGLLVLGRNVVAALAVSTLENNIVARHDSSPFPIANLRSEIDLCTLVLSFMYFVRVSQ